MSYVVIEGIFSILVFGALFFGFRRLQARKKAQRAAQDDTTGGPHE